MAAPPLGHSAGIDVLIFVEDPGAANYCASLPEALRRRGWRARLFAEGFALPYLRSRRVPVEDLQRPINVRDFLGRTQPRLVLVGTSENTDTFAFELIAEARARGVKSVGVVDTAGNAENRFRGRTDEPLHHVPEWLTVPDAWTKEAYIFLGCPEDRIVVCGHPHYDLVIDTAKRLQEGNRRQQRKKLFSGELRETPVVVFAAEISTGLNPGQYIYSQDYTLTGHGERLGRTDIVLEEFIDAVGELYRKPYLVLRLHPKNTLEELSSYIPAFDQVSRSESVFDLIHAADLVVGMTSMILVEAAIMGRPTLSIVPREVEKGSLTTIRAGLTISVTTRQQLRAILPDFMDNRFQPSKEKILEFVRFGSLERTVRFLENLLNGRPPAGMSS